VIKKFEFALTKLAFYIITPSVVVFSTLACLNRFFQLYVVKLEQITGNHNVTVGNVTTVVTDYYTYYSDEYHAFEYTVANASWQVAQFLFRDLGLAVALIVINILILVQIKQMTQRRMMLTGGHNNTTAVTDPSVLAAMKAERKRSIMIVLTGLNFVLGHSLNVAWRIIDNFIVKHASTPVWMCVQFAAYTLVAIAYATPFFFYYFFNTHFMKCANQIMKVVFYPLWRVFVRVGVFSVGENATVGKTATTTAHRGLKV
jgi:hypothetical protein